MRAINYNVIKLHSHNQFNQQLFLVFCFFLNIAKKICQKDWFELKMASHVQKTAAPPRDIIPDQISLVQPTEVFLVNSKVPPFAEMAPGPNVC